MILLKMSRLRFRTRKVRIEGIIIMPFILTFILGCQSLLKAKKSVKQKISLNPTFNPFYNYKQGASLP